MFVFCFHSFLFFKKQTFDLHIEFQICKIHLHNQYIYSFLFCYFIFVCNVFMFVMYSCLFVLP